MESPVAPVLQELERLAATIESQRAAADRATITALQAELAAAGHEIAALRAAVAHLRASQAPLPRPLRTTVARAMLATERSGGGIPTC